MTAMALSVVFWANAGETEKKSKQDPKPQKDSKSAPSEEPPQKLITTFMRKKLDASKTVLDGVVTENFVKIKKGADEMLVMSKAAEWNAIQGPVYQQYSSEFRRSVERLIKEADDKDIDGAGLAYMQLTMNCVSCHNYVKGAHVAQDDEPQIRQLSRASEAKR
jgi:hypothetical protein